MIARFIGFLFLSFLSSALAHAGNGWSDVAYPLPGPPRVIGSYTAGCIAGAVTLPLLGDGYQVMRPSRNGTTAIPCWLNSWNGWAGRRRRAAGGC